jgi:hypothetical protein
MMILFKLFGRFLIGKTGDPTFRVGPRIYVKNSRMKKMKIIGIFVALSSVLGILAFLWYSPPVLFHFKDRAALDPADGLFVVFNPFRDRQPEHMAERFLNLLSGPNKKEVISQLKAKEEYAAYLTERETAHPLTGWSLMDRQNEKGRLSLHYKAWRADYPHAVYGNVWLFLRNDNGIWKIEGFESWY